MADPPARTTRGRRCARPLFDEVGPEAAPLAALCRSPQTAELIESGGKKLAAALDASGLEPPDTPLLAWSEFM
ncbi:MAG: hypothetical protein ACREUE_16835, partial [Panacagrimonas sp.]